ncbi:hypothetical protein N7508_009501 [Penicillium antarcticum]|uniref:uncharacterized protein n=1 Tax=Penicillium antarcticum TaxID=416450 RepID=UPI002391B531|nr:uncharacterized protein N7508_009501 [Penicillium antarcticum]KAJ5294680.1 hypothetical protein N7508_009501 [Penicillium antarcticum]
MPTYPRNVLVNLGAIGGTGGGAIDFVAQTGGLVERLGVWASGKDIIGVSIKFTNDETTKKMGSGGWGDYLEFIFEDASEIVKSLSLWGNGKGTNLGRIKFTTSKGRTFDYGGHGGNKEYPMDVGCGLWVGIGGNCGATVDNMSVYFLSKVESMKMKNVKFKNDPTGTSQGIKPKMIKSAQFPWLGKSYDYKFERPRLENETHTVTETKSHSTTLGLSLTETWSGEVDLFVAKSKLEVGATESVSHVWSKEDSTADSTEITDGMTAGVSGKIESANDAVSIEAVTYTGTLDIDYTATIEVKMASGASYEIPTNGNMKKVAYSKIYMNVRPINEDTTLPPGEAEERSLENYQEDRSEKEQYQHDLEYQKAAWSPAQDAEVQNVRLESGYMNENPDDERYQSFDDLQEQQEEPQEVYEQQQRRGYGQPNYEARNCCDQKQDNSRGSQDNFQSDQNDYERDGGDSQQSQNQRYRFNNYEANEEPTSGGKYAEYKENEPVSSNDQEEDRSGQRWNSDRQDNNESYDAQTNDQDENQSEQNYNQFGGYRQNSQDHRDTQEYQDGQQYGDEQVLEEDERTYAPVEQKSSRRGYNAYCDEKGASEYAEDESSYSHDYQQQGNGWRGNRDETVF